MRFSGVLPRSTTWPSSVKARIGSQKTPTAWPHSWAAFASCHSSDRARMEKSEVQLPWFGIPFTKDHIGFVADFHPKAVHDRLIAVAGNAQPPPVPTAGANRVEDVQELVTRAARTTRSRSSVPDIGVTRETSLVTFWSLLTRERESFWPEILGFERNLEGSSRTPMDLSQTRESGDTPALDVNTCGKGGKRKTPGGEPLGVRRQLVCRF